MLVYYLCSNSGKAGIEAVFNPLLKLDEEYIGASD
jgi:hypothetical protein